MLEVGIKAPDFELPDQNGKTHRLSDYTGKKVILYFYPKDNTAAGFVQMPRDRQIVIASMLHNNAGFTVQTFQTFNQTSEFMSGVLNFKR